MDKTAVWLTNNQIPCFHLNTRQFEELKNFFPETEFVYCKDKPTFLDVLPECSKVITWGFEHEWIKLAIKLKTVITPAAGKDYLDWPQNTGIDVIYGSFHGHFMAETALGMMLSHSRGICSAIQAETSNPWPQAFLAKRMRKFSGSRVTIIGFGHIGQMIGQKAKLLGAKITGIKKNRSAGPLWFDSDDTLFAIDDDYKDYLTKTDHLVLCLPKEKQTDLLIDRKIFSHLPHHCAVYNLGRANCIKEEDLIYALEDDHIAAAYLDVFQQEPLPYSSKLRQIDSCFIFPHSSAFSPEYLDFFIQELKEKAVFC